MIVNLSVVVLSRPDQDLEGSWLARSQKAGKVGPQPLAQPVIRRQPLPAQPKLLAQFLHPGEGQVNFALQCIAVKVQCALEALFPLPDQPADWTSSIVGKTPSPIVTAMAFTYVDEVVKFIKTNSKL